MNYSQLYFAKPLEELTWADVELFFANGRNENDRLEFKSYEKSNESPEKKLNTVIRSICAFLNSEGRIVIWGAPKGTTPTGSKEEVFTGALCPVPEKYEKDRLISKVSDSITPMPVGIKVQILENEGVYVYVFEVQQSIYSPHQYLNTYWARLDGQTKPAPHYLVEALFRKITYPNLTGYLRFNHVNNSHSQYILNVSVAIFNDSVLQNEENVSFMLFCEEGIFNEAEKSETVILDMHKHRLIIQEKDSILHFGAPFLFTTNIVITQAKLSNANDRVHILLTFGGKKSPLKNSDYSLDFSKIKWHEPNLLNCTIIEKIENYTPAERKAELKYTKEQELKDFLGR
jgi:hypothetical protein